MPSYTFKDIDRAIATAGARKSMARHMSEPNIRAQAAEAEAISHDVPRGDLHPSTSADLPANHTHDMPDPGGHPTTPRSGD